MVRRSQEYDTAGAMNDITELFLWSLVRSNQSLFRDQYSFP